jgi:flagellar protein FlgJ
MTVNIQNSGIYTDFQGLACLRSQATADAPAAIKEAGKQFEALFIQMMLKSMREATPDDPLFGSQEGNTYRDLFDKQIAETLSQRGGLGLAEIVVRQLQPHTGAAESSAGAPASTKAGDVTSPHAGAAATR